MSDYVDPFAIPMLTNALTDETTSDPVPLNNTRKHWHGVEFATGVTSGVVVVEVAPTRDYGGTWTAKLTVDASSKLTDEAVLDGPGGFVRHRISTVVAGGGDPKVTSTMRRTQMGR